MNDIGQGITVGKILISYSLFLSLCETGKDYDGYRCIIVDISLWPDIGHISPYV